MRPKVETPENNNQQLLEIISDLSKKTNNIHSLHFSEDHLKKRKNEKKKFLAETLTGPARNSNSR